MKKHKLTVPISMTATLAFIITCTLSCGKKSAPDASPAPAPEPATTNSADSGNPPDDATNRARPEPANSAPAAAPTTTAAAPASAAPAPEPVSTLPVAPPATKIVEMPTTAPVAPTNFYSPDLAKNHQCCAAFATNQDFYFRFRAGYEHVNHDDNHDTWFASVKFYARPDALRERAGKNAWLIPDAEAEFAHEYLAKPDGAAHPGSGEGIALRANLFWPWMHWTTPELCRRNVICPFSRSLTLALGPTANVGFDQLFEGDRARLARYAGARLTFNRDSYIEYTLGDTDGLAGDRQQLAAELPLSQSRDGEVRYVLRGLWNRGSHNYPDELEGGIFLEMPFGLFVKPSKWGDLIPFVK